MQSQRPPSRTKMRVDLPREVKRVPTANNAVAAAVVDGKAWIVSVLGIGAGKDHLAITQRAFALDVAAGRWEPLPDVPGEKGRIAPTAQALGVRVYIFGGYSVAADGAEVSEPAVDVLDLRRREYYGPPTCRYRRTTRCPVYGAID